MSERASGTVSRLRQAAESLLLEKGQVATTLRDITDRASANVASVSYHFGSKEALLADVFRSAIEEVTQVQRARLAALPADAPLEEIVRVWLAPALPSPEPDAREARLWALIQRGVTERAPALMPHLEDVQPTVEAHLIDRLAASLPHLGRGELMLRHTATLAATATLATHGLEVFLPRADPDRVADLIVAWVIGGLRAPAAAPQTS